MDALRKRRFRRWTASVLAATWLFTVLACAVDTDAVAGEPAQVSQLASQTHPDPAHRHDGDTQDDPCCQSQSSAILSFDVVKLPHAPVLPMLFPVALLLMFAVRFTLLRVTAVPEANTVRRRSRFLVYSLQAQAPPR